MKDVRKALEQSSMYKHNKIEVLSTCKCLAIGRLKGDLILIYANGDTLEYIAKDDESVMAIYVDFIHQIVDCVGKPTPNFELVVDKDKIKRIEYEAD